MHLSVQARRQDLDPFQKSILLMIKEDHQSRNSVAVLAAPTTAAICSSVPIRTKHAFMIEDT